MIFNVVLGPFRTLFPSIEICNSVFFRLLFFSLRHAQTAAGKPLEHLLVGSLGIHLEMHPKHQRYKNRTFFAKFSIHKNVIYIWYL